MQRSPAHILADYLLGESLIDWLHARRPEVSWRKLSLELRDLTEGQVNVAPESLRAWYNAARAETPTVGNGAA